MRITCAILSGVALLYMLVAPPIFTRLYDPDDLVFTGFGIFMGVVAGGLYLLARGLNAQAFSEGISRRPVVKFLIAWGMRTTSMLGALILALVVSLCFTFSLISTVAVAIGASSLPGIFADRSLFLYLLVPHAALMVMVSTLSAICFGWFAVRGRMPPRRARIRGHS
jgi:hypothetical protein